MSTQDEFELVPVTKVVAKVKTVKPKKGKKKKKDNQRKERKATQTLAIVLGKIPGGRQTPLHSVHITISGRQLNHDPRIDSGQINIILRTQSFLSSSILLVPLHFTMSNFIVISSKLIGLKCPSIGVNSDFPFSALVQIFQIDFLSLPLILPTSKNFRKMAFL